MNKKQLRIIIYCGIIGDRFIDPLRGESIPVPMTQRFWIEIYLVGTGYRCVGDIFHHINSIIIYYGINCALTWFTSDPWLNNHNYHCGSLVVMELLSIFAQKRYARDI